MPTLRADSPYLSERSGGKFRGWGQRKPHSHSSARCICQPTTARLCGWLYSKATLRVFAHPLWQDFVYLRKPSSRIMNIDQLSCIRWEFTLQADSPSYLPERSGDKFRGWGQRKPHSHSSARCICQPAIARLCGRFYSKATLRVFAHPLWQYFVYLRKPSSRIMNIDQLSCIRWEFTLEADSPSYLPERSGGKFRGWGQRKPHSHSSARCICQPAIARLCGWKTHPQG